MSEAGVRHYLDQARKEWKERAAEAYDLAVAEELAELNALSGEAWSAWLTWKGKPDSKVLSWKFLKIAEKCSASRRALLGLDKPVKVEVDASHFVGDPDRRDHGEPMTLELASMILSEHGLLQSRPGFDPAAFAKRVRGNSGLPAHDSATEDRLARAKVVLLVFSSCTLLYLTLLAFSQ
jgi:hypothetical protein